MIIKKLIPIHKQNVEQPHAQAYAPANIALCKYWGKRDTELNLPANSSLSISLANKGVSTILNHMDAKADQIYLNSKLIDKNSDFYQKIKTYLDLLLPHRKIAFEIKTTSNIPVAAGLASSACGFAALIKALNEIMNWQLDTKALSILARLGSGSACRSLWHGFVEWQAGHLEDGMDSYGNLLSEQWKELRVGLLIFSSKPKSISSREAMQRTVETSVFYQKWLDKVNADFIEIKKAIQSFDFHCLGKTAESNALAMHATMRTAWPPIDYSLAETVNHIHKIWMLREQGLNIFFTQDAGPNLKLLFLEKDEADVKAKFPEIQIVAPFEHLSKELYV